MYQSIIPADNKIGVSFRSAVKTQKMIFVAGLPSSGKSLMLQQLAILAHQINRPVYTIQWDASRQSFETEEGLKKYPEHNNLTHPGIRKAAGIWIRQAVQAWFELNRSTNAILIAELPVVGGRFVELLQPIKDDAEAILSSSDVLFFVPIPTHEMRKVITGHRAETFANPRNDQETKDAPISIVQNEWMITRQLYNTWNNNEGSSGSDSDYCPEIYTQVFNRLMRFRHFEILNIDQSFGKGDSAYDRPVPVTEIYASDSEVSEILATIERLFPGKESEKATDGWSEY